MENSKSIKRPFAERYPWLFSAAFPWIFFAVIAFAASVHRLLLGSGSFNNYTIFEYSWKHLLDNVNLYVAYPEEHYDLYKYSPTFAFLMAPFWMLPRCLGLIVWNMLNMLAPVWAISKLNLQQKQKNLILFLVFIELLSSVQNAQSNGLMLGLMIGAFAYFEKGKPVVGMLLICFGFYIKLFAAVAAVLLLFYPNKLKSIVAGAVFVVVLAALPLTVISWDQLIGQYNNWLVLLGNDPAHELNFSIMTLAERAFGLHAGDVWFLIPGMLLLLLPLVRLNQYSSFSFRLHYLCSLLIWVVIFNHKAESPTYCIALVGIAIWYIINEKTTARNVLMILAFLLVALSPTDLFPPYIRIHFIQPYSLKALMPVIIWLMISWDLMRKVFPSSAEPSALQTA